MEVKPRTLRSGIFPFRPLDPQLFLPCVDRAPHPLPPTKEFIFRGPNEEPTSYYRSL